MNKYIAEIQGTGWIRTEKTANTITTELKIILTNAVLYLNWDKSEHEGVVSHNNNPGQSCQETLFCTYSLEQVSNT